MKEAASREYHTILKSTSIIGGSSAIVIVGRMVRTKILASLLGPSGVGLIGVYQSLIDLVVSIASIGIRSSGVRQIAEAVGTGDREQIGKTVVVVRRIGLLLGCLGMVIMILLSNTVSQLTFGNGDHSNDLSLLSICILLLVVSGSQVSLIQGMRRLTGLAKMSVFNSLAGLGVTIPIVYLLGERGIPNPVSPLSRSPVSAASPADF